MRAMLTKTELDALRGALRNKLLPELGAVRERRQDQYDETDDSHQHMEPFRDVAEALQKEFSEDDEVQGVIAREQSLCEQWALENVVEDQSPEPRSLTIGEQEPQHAGARGVFDDGRSEERRDGKEGVSTGGS